MSNSGSESSLSFVHSLPVVGRVSRKSRELVGDHQDLVAVVLTGLAVYGTYRLAKWAKNRWAPKAGMADFAEEGDYDLSLDDDGMPTGADYGSLPVESVPTKQSRRVKAVPVVRDAEARQVAAEETYGDDFGSEVVADEYVASDDAGDNYDV